MAFFPEEARARHIVSRIDMDGRQGVDEEGHDH